MYFFSFITQLNVTHPEFGLQLSDSCKPYFSDYEYLHFRDCTLWKFQYIVVIKIKENTPSPETSFVAQLCFYK